MDLSEKPTLYLESSVISYCVGRPSRDVLVLAHQNFTAEWWKKAVLRFRCVVSAYVLAEISRGDILAVKRRLKLVDGLPIIGASDQVEKVAASLWVQLQLSQDARLDAFHIAIAAIHSVDFLVTWNCRHIANAAAFPRIRSVLESFALRMPTICTPIELQENRRA